MLLLGESGGRINASTRQNAPNLILAIPGCIRVNARQRVKSGSNHSGLHVKASYQNSTESIHATVLETAQIGIMAPTCQIPGGPGRAQIDMRQRGLAPTRQTASIRLPDSPFG